MKKPLVLTCAVLAACCGTFAGCGGPSSAADVNEFELSAYMKPLWEGDVVICEPAFVLKNPDGSISPIGLTYAVKEIISVRDSALGELYSEGEDYTAERGKLVIAEGGRIYAETALAYGDYYFDSPTASSLVGINGGGLLKTEAENGLRGLTKWQISVTYTHGESESPLSKPASKSEKFPKTLEKLKGGEKVNLVCLGDSISAGWSASGYQYCNIEPYCPPYFNLVSDFLAEHFKNDNVDAANFSVGGMCSDWGAAPAQIKSVADAEPDLLILAFGMNDGVSNGLSVAQYQENMLKIIDGVRAVRPSVEIVLVSPMLPNAEVSGMLVNQYNYVNALKQIETERENTALADVATASFELLQRKKFRDLSANNVNHPNDFLHRVYAQVVVKTIADIL